MNSTEKIQSTLRESLRLRLRLRPKIQEITGKCWHSTILRVMKGSLPLLKIAMVLYPGRKFISTETFVGINIPALTYCYNFLYVILKTSSNRIYSIKICIDQQVFHLSI